MMQATPEVDHFAEPTMISDVKTSVIGNSIVYIAGYIMWKLTKVLSRDICHQSLVTTKSSIQYWHLYTLLEIQNIGGLVRPSDGFMRFLLTADQYFHINSKPDPLHCVLYVISSAGSSDVLCLGKHLTDTADSISNHCASSMRNLI